jgi:hypothetical protein
MTHISSEIVDLRDSLGGNTRGESFKPIRGQLVFLLRKSQDIWTTLWTIYQDLFGGVPNDTKISPKVFPGDTYVRRESP